MKFASLVVLLLLPFPAWGASPEELYLASRDRFIAGFKKTEDAKDQDKRFKAEERARADLESQLRTVIGPFAMKDVPATGRINLDSLLVGDEGFGMLDGLVFATPDAKTSVVVSTPGLLQRWLRGEADVPQDRAAALAAESFYTFAVSPDAAVIRYADLPIAKPAGAAFAYAMLGAHTQADSPRVPDEIFVAVVHGDRVMIVDTHVVPKAEPIAVCDEVVHQAAKKADAAYARYQASQLKDEKAFDDSTRFRDEGDIAFRKCFGEKARDQTFFKPMTARAQALIDALPPS